ncbi:hypothetical protein DL89DRAFT_127924 [Linderina pennispora]|uniref:Transmembrane protein n=1 Tax=Linderina pennispora TaxID=61395 RepID=A0A1Y1WE62_9FUNG|nr:uncharacterized protein DL89DRAFT_127924 [Linderina pennispora]ORX71526.1 hypothetical protein DL89DRAFT_127924 [Linderina pennispora]
MGCSSCLRFCTRSLWAGCKPIAAFSLTQRVSFAMGADGLFLCCSPGSSSQAEKGSLLKSRFLAVPLFLLQYTFLFFYFSLLRAQPDCLRAPQLLKPYCTITRTFLLPLTTHFAFSLSQLHSASLSLPLVPL